MKKELSDKRRLSGVGLCYFALMFITQALQMLAMGLLYDRLADTEWFLWALSLVPLYAIALPIFLLMAKKLAPDAPAAYGLSLIHI